MGRLTVVADGQFGSTGKGAVTAWLSGPETIGVRVGGPNAGHTVLDQDGTAWPLRQVPVTAVTSRVAPLVIAAGSEIDLSVLDSEVRALEEAGHNVLDRLLIDSEATIIQPHHSKQEQALQHGTTAKGIGAARADRLMRRAKRYQDVRDDGVHTVQLLMYYLHGGSHVIIEGTQGFGLGSHAGYYPFATSGNCRAIDFLAQAGISPWSRPVSELEIWLTARPYPIRIAGNSGPLKGETTWEALGLPPERTTVTKKTRRVGEWDPDLLVRAVAANGPGRHLKLALTMVDQLFPSFAGTSGFLAMDELPFDVSSWVRGIEAETGTPVGYLGTGPSTAVML